MPKKPANIKNEKQLQKVVEDKTFGMKNKKNSKKVQKLTQQIASKDGGLEQMRNKMYEEKKRKKLEAEEKKLLSNVLANAHVGEEIGKKKVCQFFKVGLCNKGKRCKKSHNVEDEIVNTNDDDREGKVEAGEKIDLFTDQRQALFGNKDVIDNWDNDKLEEVVNYNQTKYLNHVKTEKICKHFLDAVERRIYGWMWVCPNGHECHFRHCLPQGYVFKNKEQKVEQKGPSHDEVIDKIDNDRNQLDAEKLTPVTEERFFAWLAKRKVTKEKERQKRIDEDFKEMGIKQSKGMTGRELFEKKQNLFKDAEDAFDEYKKEENVEIDENAFDDEELPDL